MRIALDAVGGDFGCAPLVEGAVRAVRELPCHAVLVGPEPELRERLAAHGVAAEDARFRIVHTAEVVGMDEDPADACREKKRASVMLAAQLVAEGEADGFFSAGNSGAAMVAALWHLKRLPDILRPAIAAPFPTLRGTCVVLDAGANVSCKPWHLLQFGMLGALYAETVLGVERPSVGILSNGEEESKGNDLVKEAIPLLKHSGLNWYGPVEGRDIPSGTVDVVVTDGFTGNVAIKTAEGTAHAMKALIKSEVKRSPLALLGGLLMKGAMEKVKRRMSDEEAGGAPLLGVGGTAVIGHGRTSPLAVYNGMRVVKQLAQAGVPDKVRERYAAMRASIEMARALE